MASKKILPEVDFRQFGNLVAGVDEVGRGCLAGPVAAAAVILKSDFNLPGLTDSKKLSPQQRQEFAAVIKHEALSWAVAMSSVEEIGKLNILWASMLAMRRAIEKLSPKPEIVLVDGNCQIPELLIPQKTLVQGDARCLVISAASVLAKVARDEFMEELEQEIPGYGFADHKGYPTPSHRKAIQELGVTSWHRTSFKLL